MIDITDEINNNQIILLVVPKNEFHKQTLHAAKVLANSSNKVAFVSLSQPYSTLKNNLISGSIDITKILFIDTLTAGVQDPPDADDCIFVSSPNALTEISVALSKSISEHGCNGTIIDSLSSLLVYENTHSLIQFTHNIITKLRVSSNKAILISLKEDINSELLKDLYMFVDNVIEL